MPTSRAPWTAQIAATRDTSCTISSASPIDEGLNATVLPYRPGMIRVNTMFDSPTSTSGSRATSGWARCSPAKGSGSLSRFSP